MKTKKQCSKCKHNRQWHVKNPEYDRQYYTDHRKKSIKRARQWQIDHHKECLKRSQQYRAKHRKKVNELGRRHYAKHRKEYRRYSQQWKAKHPDIVRAWANRHRALKLSAEGSYTVDQWVVLRNSYNGICPCCKQRVGTKKLTLDHIIPLSKGGSNFIRNIQPLCKSCNSSKGTKTVKYDQ